MNLSLKRVMMYKLFVGVDPGTLGALVSMSAKGKILKYHSMPIIKSEMSLDRLKAILNGFCQVQTKTGVIKLPKSSVLVLLEQPAPFMKKSSKSSVMTQGKNYGLLKGMVYGSGFPFIEIRPSRWTGKFYKGYGKKYTTKQKALLVFENQFHRSTAMFVNARGKTPGKGKLEGLVDATLIADYGRLFYSQEGDNE